MRDPFQIKLARVALLSAVFCIILPFNIALMYIFGSFAATGVLLGYSSVADVEAVVSERFGRAISAIVASPSTTWPVARSRLIGAGSRDAKIDAANDLSSALSRLLVIAEQYPDLKANQQFARLSDELAGTENRIATERRRYNELVQQYNTRLRRFPSNVTGKLFGFKQYPFFQAPPDAVAT